MVPKGPYPYSVQMKFWVGEDNVAAFENNILEISFRIKDKRIQSFSIKLLCWIDCICDKLK